MSDLISAYRRLILPKAVCGIDTSKRCLTLKEDKNRGKANTTDRVVIAGLPSDSFAFTLDLANHALSDLVGPQVAGVRDKCDAVLITQVCQSIYVLFIEMKSGQPGGFTQQLKSADCFADYLNSLARKFLSSDIRNIKRLNVLFHQPVALPSGRRDVVVWDVKGMKVVKSTKTHVHLNELISAA